MKDQIQSLKALVASAHFQAISQLTQLVEDPQRCQRIAYAIGAHGEPFAAFLLIPGVDVVHHEELMKLFNAMYVGTWADEEVAKTMLVRFGEQYMALRKFRKSLDLDDHFLPRGEERLQSELELAFKFIETEMVTHVFNSVPLRRYLKR